MDAVDVVGSGGVTLPGVNSDVDDDDALSSVSLRWDVSLESDPQSFVICC